MGKTETGKMDKEDNGATGKEAKEKPELEWLGANEQFDSFHSFV